MWYTEGIFTNAILGYKIRQLCGIQKVYSQMQAQNTILGKTTLWYTDGIFTNAILEQVIREDSSVVYRRYIHNAILEQDIRDDSSVLYRW